MPESASVTARRTQSLVRSAEILVWVAIALIIVTAAIEHFVWPALEGLRAHEIERAGLGALDIVLAALAQSILIAPAWLMALALLDLRTALREYQQGELFSPRAGAAVRSAGEWMVWAMIAKTTLSPSVYSYVTQGGGGFEFHFESFDIAVIAVATFVMLSGRILEAAAAIKAENDEIV